MISTTKNNKLLQLIENMDRNLHGLRQRLRKINNRRFGMKTFRYLILATIFLSFSNIANAIPTTTWTDTMNTGQWITAGSTISFDLAGDSLVTPSNYTLGVDTISSARLDIDILGLGAGSINILSNANSQSMSYFVLGFNDIDITLSGRIVNDLSSTGLLTVIFDKNSRWPWGCQWLDSMTLTACGNDNSSAPVPEPGTLLLLGSGFMGLAAYGRRRIKG